MTFYATIGAGHERPTIQPAGSYLYPASSFFTQRYKGRAPRIPGHCTDVAADSGGFVATYHPKDELTSEYFDLKFVLHHAYSSDD